MSEYIKKLNNLAYENEMERAINDKLKEAENENVNINKVNNNNINENKDDLDDESFDSEDDEVLQKMKEKMMGNIGKENKEEEKNLDPGKTKYKKGKYLEVNEDEFFKITTNEKISVCHFYHKDFLRCQILDKHLEKIAFEHNDIFIFKIDVNIANFVVRKMKITVLPTIIIFKDGVVSDMIIGFEELGIGDDNFKTSDLLRRLSKANIFSKKLYLNHKDKDVLNKGLHNDYYDSEDEEIS